MTVRLPSARTKDIILRVSLKTANMLALAAARESVDVEVIAERVLQAAYDPSGRTKSERARAKAEAEQERLKAHHRSLGLSQEPDAEAEVLRLSRLANGA